MASVVDTVLNHHSLTHSGPQHVLAVKMASVVDTVLNHHSLTHSLRTATCSGREDGLSCRHVLNHHLLTHSGPQHVLAVKMVSVVDTVLNHHSLTHSLRTATCSGREDGLSCRHGVKPPLTHSGRQHVLAVKMASVVDTVLNHHSLTHSGRQHVLAVKMASVVDTVLNHHLLTHSGPQPTRELGIDWL